MNNQVQNKPTAAYILSLLGGIIGLLAALAFIAFGAMTSITYNDWISSYSGYYYASDILFGLSWTILLGFGIWMLIASILVIIFARKLNSNPMEHTKWSALILVFSLLGGGTILGFIGGILGLIYKPVPYGTAPQYQQPYVKPQQDYAPPPTYAQPVPQQTNRICSQCGRFINENIKFCPYCGKQLS